MNLETTAKENLPLVSVCVVSYNSSSTIVETLDSIQAQTYPNTELIISDDCSKDNTAQVVKKWIDENKNGSTLVNIKLIPNEQNGGTCKNLNTAIKASNGKYIKILAADDLLVPNAIEEFVKFCEKEKCDFCVCDVEVFPKTISDIKYHEAIYEYYFNTLYGDYEKKKKQILKKYNYPGPAYFFSRKLFEKIGGYDEQYDLAEEWQFCFHALYNGFDIIPLDMRLVKYRISDSSVCRNSATSRRLLEADIKLFNRELKPEMKKRGMYFSILNRKYNLFIDSHIKKHLTNKFLHLLSPVNFINTLILKTKINSFKNTQGKIK